MTAAGTATTAAGQTGAAPVRPPRTYFPLRVETGKRFMVDASGQPFFIHGDTAWSLIAQLTLEQAEQYLEDRRRKGFNTILVNLIEHHYADKAPANIYGIAPFLEPGDFSTPNPAYFTHAEQVVALAARRNMLVMMTPAYVGYGGGHTGWYQEMMANGSGKLRDYGRYVASRFAAYDNVLWVQGGDYDVPDKSLIRAIAEGIREVHPAALQTYHGARRTSALDFFGPDEPWLNVNTIYEPDTTIVRAALDEHERSQFPYFLIEGYYENEHGIDAGDVRRQAYQAILSGASGHLMGNRPVWRFSSGWQRALDSAGAVKLQHLRRLVMSLKWWSLEPDRANKFLTVGAGSGPRAVAALTRDRTEAVVYLPSLRFITLDLKHLAGSRVTARWYDPTTGESFAASSRPLPTGGTRTFAPPSLNSDMQEDWILVLRSAPQAM